MSSGEQDEQFALKASLTVMAIVSLTMLALRFILNRQVFTLEFEASLVYAPTIVLLWAWRSEQNRTTVTA